MPLVDTRAAIAAELEALLREHHGDEDGWCVGCAAAGEPEPYPCAARLICERAVDALARRRERAARRAPEIKTKEAATPGGRTRPARTPEWRRASGCDRSSGNHVEIARLGDSVALRDSKDINGPVLVYTREEWDTFVAGLRADEFDFWPAG